MIVDLSKVKAGDEVEFRCGGKAVVGHIFPQGSDYDELHDFYYGFVFVDNLLCFRKDGRHYGVNSPFDIVRITPKAFDWANAKPGMAFTELSTGYVLYMVDDYTNAYGFAKRSVVLDKITASVNLKRAPEYDIKIDKNG